MIRLIIGKLRGTKQVEQSVMQQTEKELVLLDGTSDRIDYRRDTDEEGRD